MRSNPFHQLLMQGVWTIPDDQKILFVTVLAMCDRKGVADVAGPALQRFSGLDGLRYTRAIAGLLTLKLIESAPEVGWRVVNFAPYLQAMDRQRANARYMASR